MSTELSEKIETTVELEKQQMQAERVEQMVREQQQRRQAKDESIGELKNVFRSCATAADTQAIRYGVIHDTLGSEELLSSAWLQFKRALAAKTHPGVEDFIATINYLAYYVVSRESKYQEDKSICEEI